jgi:predicted RNase H-like HicB family nuclease
MRACPAALSPDPDGGFTVTFRDVPEAITEGDRREEALLRAEDALESALAMCIAAKEPLPASSDPKANEEMVPLSAWGMAKTRSTTRCGSKASAARNSLAGSAGTCRKSVVCSICLTLHAWNTSKRHSRGWVCG